MVNCKHCNTHNSLDSTFCKRCGTSLPEDDLAVAREKLEAIVAEGNSALNEGKLEEAAAVAESALLSNPSHVGALSLKCAIHERRGEIAESLECAERIVELNPDSELDKIKRNQLRSALVSHAKVAAAVPDKRIAYLAAFAAMVLVGSLPVIYMRMTNRPQTLASNAPVSGGSTVPMTNPAATGTPDAGPQNPSVQPDTNQVNVPAPQPNNQPGNTPAVSETTSPSNGGGVLPWDGTANPTGAIIRPVPLPNPEGTTTPRPSQPEKKQSDRNTDPDPTPGPRSEPPPAQVVEEDKGTYDIQVHSGTKRNVGGSEVSGVSNSRTDGTGAYSEVARSQFQIGNYAGAVANYERALQTGGDPVSINQRLGQSYERLGKSSEAASAYEKAIRACDAAIASGRGNRERLMATKDACASALKVVRGN